MKLSSISVINQRLLNGAAFYGSSPHQVSLTVSMHYGAIGSVAFASGAMQEVQCTHARLCDTILKEDQIDVLTSAQPTWLALERCSRVASDGGVTVHIRKFATAMTAPTSRRMSRAASQLSLWLYRLCASRGRAQQGWQKLQQLHWSSYDSLLWQVQ